MNNINNNNSKTLEKIKVEWCTINYFGRDRGERIFKTLDEANIFIQDILHKANILEYYKITKLNLIHEYITSFI